MLVIWSINSGPTLIFFTSPQLVSFKRKKAAARPPFSVSDAAQHQAMHKKPFTNFIEKLHGKFSWEFTGGVNMSQ